MLKKKKKNIMRVKLNFNSKLIYMYSEIERYNSVLQMFYTTAPCITDMHELNDKCLPETGGGFHAVRFCAKGAKDVICTMHNNKCNNK